MEEFLEHLEALIAQARRTSHVWTDLGEELDLAIEATYPDSLTPFDGIVRGWEGWLDQLRRDGA